MAHTLAIIPARKGSKRIPGKNTRFLNGRPLVEYTIGHALAARLVNQVVVSTNDEGVERLAKKFDCIVLRRPEELSTDSAPTIHVIRHCLDFLQKNGNQPDYVVLLQPTVPIRDIGKIDEAVQILQSTRCDSVVSHIRVDYFHPNRMKKIREGRIVPYGEEEIEGASRDRLPEAYYRDGSIYAMRSRLPLETNSIFGKDQRPLINDRRFFINIDEERDWRTAELLMEEWEACQKKN